MTDDEEREPALMLANLDLRRRQVFWETPKGIAAVVAATAVTVGALAGVLGFEIGRTPPTQPQIIFQPGSIVVQQPGAK